MKSKVIVQDAAGTEIGQIIQGAIGKIRFALVANDQRYGMINGEN